MGYGMRNPCENNLRTDTLTRLSVLRFTRIVQLKEWSGAQRGGELFPR